MGSCGEEEDGNLMTSLDASVGALVWVRRRNGSWWPARILGPQELPENCIIPPRSGGTPIKLLGREDGSIDWYNLEKSKRVKAFRCGEYDECIEKAKAHAARNHKRTFSEGKYVRREDAILHALEIERSRFPTEDNHLEDETSDAIYTSQGNYSTKSKIMNGVNKKSCRAARELYDIEENSAQGLSQSVVLFEQPKNMSSSSTRYASSSKKKRKTPNDSEDDTTEGFQRMRDLREIGSKKILKQKSNAGTFSKGPRDLDLLESEPNINHDLSSTSQIKRTKQSHASTKRKRSNMDQAYENSRRKDRRRPLSKLCKGATVIIPSYCHWDPSGQSSVQGPGDNTLKAFEPSGGKAGFSVDMDNCSDSSGTSSVETLLDTSCSNHSGAVKTNQVKDTELSCMTGFLDDDCSDGDGFIDVPLVVGDIFEGDYSQTFGSYASTKDQPSTPEKQATDCSKEAIPFQYDDRNCENKIIGSANQITRDSMNRDKNVSEHDHNEKKVVKYQAPSNEVVGLDKKVENGYFNKPLEPENKSQTAIVPADLASVGAMEQYSAGEPEHDESSETISNHSNSEKGVVSSPVSGLPLQESLTRHKAPHPTPAQSRVIKPIKSVPMNSTLYVVELSVQGSYKGPRVPLVSLMSKWNRKPIVGYPVSVEVLENVFGRPPVSRSDHRPATSSLNRLLKRSEAADARYPRSSYAARSKPSSRGKISEHKMDKSWRPHTRKSGFSPRKMRRLSSFAASNRDKEDRKPVVEKIAGPTIACIPLRLVFSRINEALSFPVRSENPS